jgi:O-antigen ligase
MTPAEVSPRDRLASWCGGWLVAVFALTPLLAWGAPLGFAALAALAGLACLPAFRVRNRDRAIYVALIGLAVWAVGSSVWSPHRPALQDSMALKLCAEVILFFSVVCAAHRASGRGLRIASRMLAWSVALLGLIMLTEALTGAGLYQAARAAMDDPIRPDLGAKNVAQGLFILALMLGPASVAAWRNLNRPWLILPMAAGLGAGCLAFGYDAPILALAIALVVGVATWAWPSLAPRACAVFAGIYILCAPVIVLALRASGLYATIQAEVPLSWSQRMGYWRRAADLVLEHPARGWGLDASRTFTPAIQLHPHNGALQIWLELGIIGALAAAAFWALVFLRLVRRERDPTTAVGAAACAAYLVFGSVSFGVWQEWWLGLGALMAAALAVAARAPAFDKADLRPQVIRASSTAAPISE